MIDLILFSGEEEKREMIREVERIVGSVREMLEVHRAIEDGKFCNKLKKVVGVYKDMSGPLMSDLISCCVDISEDIAIGFYKEEPDNARVVSDLSELAYLTLSFLRESNADIKVYSLAFGVYKDIIHILEGMVIKHE